VDIRLCRALHVNGALGGRVIDAARIGSIGSCEYTTLLIAGSSILAINGTAPGVLLRVWRQCVRGVFLRWRFTVGFRDCMIGGVSVIRSIVVIGVLSINLCCCSCSASLTLCSFSFATDGLIFLVIWVWRFLMRVRPCGVCAAVLVSLASSLVNA